MKGIFSKGGPGILKSGDALLNNFRHTSVGLTGCIVSFLVGIF